MTHRLLALAVYLIAVAGILRWFWAASPRGDALDHRDQDLPERAEGLLPDDMSDEDWDRWMNGDLIVHDANIISERKRNLG